MEGEDFKTLEAVLALIEECDDVSSTASSSGGSDTIHDTSVELMMPQPDELEASEGAESSAQNIADRKQIQRLKTKLAVPGRNRSRDLHRLELLKLRVEAAELQQRVEDIEREQRRRRPRTQIIISDEEIGLIETTDDILYDAWRNLATKHKRLRRSAEIENRNLRALYTRQLKTTNIFKKLFRKQTSIREQLGFRGAVST